ncbi:MAG: sigma-54 dependent transcriptional regulator [Desulfobacteraceae bacterium]|jgi:DNA-binding NtrC family response regulator
MPPEKTILIVDDRKSARKVISAILKDEGYHVLQAGSGLEALDIFRRRKAIDAVLSDLKMPGMDGLDLFRQMKKIRTPPPFVIMTAYGTVQSAVQALKEGAANYLIKPLDYDELSIVLDKAVREYAVSMELKALKKEMGREQAFHGMIGADPKMTDLFDRVRTVGPTDASVLIYGETGTGKELLARALHMESPRRKEEMVCINSAALSETLLEAELFGYVKGAFTGALADRKGRLETAHKGTLFLDEIGHMSLGLQTKLLRFLQEMAFEPVGGSTSRSVDVRIIAATNLDLQAEIRAGRFLNDLLYRIEVVPLRLPALRQRRDDIYLLVDHYIRQFARQYNKPVTSIDPGALQILSDYHWPGNVRELKNCIARSVILSKSSAITAEDLPQKITTASDLAEPQPDNAFIRRLPEQGVTLRRMECELIRMTLAKHKGNKSLTAQSLGISRKTLYEKIERYGIDCP